MLQLPSSGGDCVPWVSSKARVTLSCTGLSTTCKIMSAVALLPWVFWAHVSRLWPREICKATAEMLESGNAAVGSRTEHCCMHAEYGWTMLCMSLHACKIFFLPTSYRLQGQCLWPSS